ncbi:Aminopeptidase [Balamuthia mandrillaris]
MAAKGNHHHQAESYISSSSGGGGSSNHSSLDDVPLTVFGGGEEDDDQRELLREQEEGEADREDDFPLPAPEDQPRPFSFAEQRLVPAVLLLIGFAVLVFLLFLFVGLNHGSSTPPPSMNNTTRVLLPKDVIPLKYYIHLTPNFDDFTFHGLETVDIKVNTSTKTLTIHSRDIKIDSAKVDGQSATISYDEKEETVTFTFDEALKEDASKLEVDFRGTLNDQMAGFYRSKYMVGDKEKYMATTQFEPTDARRAFPCWDEPAVKATFEVTLTIPAELQALSNMPQDSKVTNEKGQNVITFQETPIMSTYLLAFIVGEFDYTETQTKEDVTVRVYTPVGKKEQGRFALDVGAKILSYYSDWFDIPYPLPKLDMIAIADFAAGAMENWGLVTYRETALLIDPENSSVSQKQRVAYVVAHELAHQWFGNLVTMEWWKELWLNEGFATFMGNQAVAQLFPEWNIWTQFVTDYIARALELDGLKNSHPIEVEVSSSAQVNEIFDAISYSKGASVIRMVANYLGEERFQKGLQIYLGRHKYANAVTEDLWAALAESSGLPVKEFMDNWTKAVGYPVLSIEETEKAGVYATEQQRFLSSGETVEGNSTVWWMNVGFISSTSQEAERVDIKDTKQEIEVTSAKGAAWVKANANSTGFFRVKYSPAMVQKLLAALDGHSLGTIDRLGIQNDAFALAKAGHLPTSQVLTLASAYGNETDYTIWSDLSINLAQMASVWEAEPAAPQLNAFIRSLIGPAASNLGWDKKQGEEDLQTLLRTVLLSRLVDAGDEATINEAKTRFQKFLNDSKAIPADLRGVVYKAVVSNGGAVEWDSVYKIYKEATLHEEKIRALRALGYTHDEDRLQRTLRMSLDTNEVRAQDVMYVIVSTADSVEGREITWRFVQDNWSKYMELLGDGGTLLTRVISYSTKGFTSEEKAEEVEHFFAEHPYEPAARTVKQSLEAIRSNAAWLARDRDAVAQWLDSHTGGSSQ